MSPTESPTAKRPARDKFGKTHQPRGIRTLDSRRVAILGVDILSREGLPADAWLLCDCESNITAPSAELLGSIAASRQVNLPIKVVAVPVTEAIADFEFVDDNNVAQGFVLLVVWGRHRVRASRAVEGDGAGLIPLQAIIAHEKETFAELATQALIENVVRRKLAPTREALQFQSLHENGLNIAEIARRIGIETGVNVTSVTIHNKLSLLKLGQSIMDLVDAGEIGVTHAYVIAKTPPEHHARLAGDAMAGCTVAQLQKTARELVALDKPAAQAEISVPTAIAPDDDSDQSEQSGDESQESDYTPPPAQGTAPTATRTKRPKAADIAEMIERLAGSEPHMVAAREALRFVQGEQSDEQLIAALSALMGCPFPAPATDGE